ncbi:MAG: triose-phosphate isomerase [Bacteroidota bacterium]
MRQQIAAGNWKMNTTYQEGIALAKAVATGKSPDEVQIILGTPAIYLAELSQLQGLAIAAQNCHQAEKGAYTGEISADMIASTGTTHVILGHSERRAYYGENDALIAEKVKLVLAKGLVPIYCCGEQLPTREVGQQNEVVEGQIKEGLFHLDTGNFSKVIIAYEPVWAIGTGVTASPAQAQEMHQHIRKLIAEKYGQTTAESTSILYGGSVKPANAKEIFAQPDVDGGLVGGASLKADSFLAIANSF